MTQIISLIRRIAKNSHYQTLYSFCKESGGLKLFKNDRELSDIQMTFLRYLGFYASLYLDVALGDVEDRIFENEIYEDSYALYRNKKDKKEDLNQNKRKEDFVTTSRWIFKSPKGNK